MDFGAILAFVKAVSPAVATIAAGVAAVVHYLIVRKTGKDHAILVDKVAEIAGTVAARVNPAPQDQAPTAGSTP